MRLHAGTSGFSYKEWKGQFYPEGLPNSRMLSFYAERLAAVEINNTFYRLPRRDVIASWADDVPEDFRFALKASRRITHFKRLKDAQDVTEYMCSAALSLGSKLGPILFQLPPNFPKDVERMRAFLPLLPSDVRAAFEFRHDSWYDPEVFGLLSDFGAAWCVADDGEEAAQLVRTTDWGYLRLRKPGYDERDLEEWASRIADQNWEDAFVFFKHEDDGAGPKMAASFVSKF